MHSSQGGTWRRQGIIGASCTIKRFYLDIKREFFYSEDNWSLEQPPQRCDRIPVTGAFQDAVGQVAK